MNNTKIIEWLLRVGVSSTFIVHSIYALGGNSEWLTWIMNFTGMDVVLAGQALFAVGILDAVVGIIVFFKPIRVVLLWAVLWTSWTAIMRILPFIGEPVLETLEELIVPTSVLALLLLRGWPKKFSSWFK